MEKGHMSQTYIEISTFCHLYRESILCRHKYMTLELIFLYTASTDEIKILHRKMNSEYMELLAT